MTSRPKIAIEKIFWRGAWILVKFKDKHSRFIFDEATIQIFHNEELIAVGRADTFYETDKEHDDRVMIDIAEIYRPNKPPNKLTIIFEKQEMTLPIALISESVKKNETFSAYAECQA
jgi:hypothetical protein